MIFESGTEYFCGILTLLGYRYTHILYNKYFYMPRVFESFFENFFDKFSLPYPAVKKRTNMIKTIMPSLGLVPILRKLFHSGV